MIRRDFLAILAGSPIVFGLRELFAQESTPPSSEWLKAALKRMKETRRFGVVLVIPADKEAQKRLGEGLLSRLPTGSKAGREGFELFCATIFVCLGEAGAREFGGSKPEGDGIHRILLGPEGRWVAADRIAPDVFKNAGQFRESFTKFVHGTDGARLREHALAIEKEMPEEIKKAGERVNGEPAEARPAMNLLKSKADSIAPWLVMKGSEKEGARFTALLWEYYLEQAGKDPEPCLPYGVRVERVQVEDPCPPCGEVAFRSVTNRFLSFYEK